MTIFLRDLSHEIQFLGVLSFSHGSDSSKNMIFEKSVIFCISTISIFFSQLRIFYFFSAMKNDRDFFLLKKINENHSNPIGGFPIHTVKRAEMTLFRTCSTSLPG